MKRTKKNKGGGYPGPRDPATGMTPRQLLDVRRRQDLEIDMAKKRGLLVLKSDVDAGQHETAEVIQSDIYGVLPSRCATELGGKKLTAEQVRQIVLNIVNDVVDNWINAEIIPKESKPNENSRPHQKP